MAYAYSFTQSCPGSSLVFPTSLGDAPVMSPYWSGDGNKRLLPGLQQEVGWDWIRRLDSNRMEPLNAGWWVWPLSFSPGNKVQTGRVRESGHRTARGEDRKIDEARQVGQKGKVNHDSKSPLIAHKTWGKSVSHILFSKNRHMQDPCACHKTEYQ